MKSISTFFITLLLSLSVQANEFGWVNDFNADVRIDELGVKWQLGKEFKINNTEIDFVISNSKSAGDAYVNLALGKISGRPTPEVIMSTNKIKAGGVWRKIWA